MKTQKASPRRIKAKQKMTEAVRLRVAGYTFKQIAELVGYQNPANAARVIYKYMDELEQETRLTIEAQRELENERLDHLTYTVWTHIDQCREQDPGANLVPFYNLLVRISERRSKLNGLDMTEQRLATALEIESKQREINNDFLYEAVTKTLDRLALTAEERNNAINILAEELEKMGSDSD